MRLSEQGRAVVLRDMAFWVEKNGDIHLVTNDPDWNKFHIRVPASRSHRDFNGPLYWNLCKMLRYCESSDVRYLKDHGDECDHDEVVKVAPGRWACKCGIPFTAEEVKSAEQAA